MYDQIKVNHPSYNLFYPVREIHTKLYFKKTETRPVFGNGSRNMAVVDATPDMAGNNTAIILLNGEIVATIDMPVTVSFNPATGEHTYDNNHANQPNYIVDMVLPALGDLPESKILVQSGSYGMISFSSSTSGSTNLPISEDFSMDCDIYIIKNNIGYSGL